MELPAIPETDAKTDVVSNGHTHSLVGDIRIVDMALSGGL